MSTITVRFIGICCFVNNGNGKRVVLPVDNRASQRKDGVHVPYIEMELVDQPRSQGQFAGEATYVRDLVTYRRLHLSNDRVSITNAANPNGAQLNVLSTYTERVPALTLVEQDLPANAAAGLLGNNLNSKQVAAYFDITHGDLHAGPPNLHHTKFSAPTAWPLRRLAQWVELQIAIPDGQGPAIEVDGFGPQSRGKRTIQLSERTSRITIGNQLVGDIERNSTDPLTLRKEDFREHFELYYDVLANVPADPSRPERTAALPNGCVGTQFP